MNRAAIVVKLEFLAQAIARYPRPQPCPHCGSASAELLARKYLVVRVVRCRGCGLSYVRPLYRTLLSDNFYDHGYSAEGSTTELPSAAELARLVATDFRGSDKDFSLVAGKLCALAPAGRVLEIGSSWGYALHAFKRRGCDVMGLEIGARRRRFGVESLGVPAARGWEELPPGSRFDLVFSSHALEHFLDLSQVFSQISSHLTDGGLMCVEVPNFDFEQRGPAALPVVGAIHPLGFDSAFFRRNLPRVGLEVLGVFPDWDHFPAQPVERSGGEVVIVLARKVRAGAPLPAP